MDPNDPNYDPDEDEPRRAPVALHAGHSEEVAAFKRAVRLQCLCAPAALCLDDPTSPALLLAAFHCRQVTTQKGVLMGYPAAGRRT